jgi:hypothetical protein
MFCEERNIAETVIDELKEESARQRLLLQPFRWENQPHGYGRPQTVLNRELRSAELTIVILWSKLGSVINGCSETGSQQELRIAGELVTEGRSDDVFVYFRNLRNHPTNGDPHEVERVRHFRENLEKTNNLLFSEYEDPARSGDGFLAIFGNGWSAGIRCPAFASMLCDGPCRPRCRRNIFPTVASTMSRVSLISKATVKSWRS